MKTAIITGVGGQDGAFLAALLLKKNYRVIGTLPTSRDSNLFRLDYLNIKENIVFRKIDLLKESEIEALFEEEKPDEVYNLAALSSVGYSFKHPIQTLDFNTKSVLNILEGIRKVSPKTKFYQASSSEMFGNIDFSNLPIRESFLFHPVSPYGISKASAHWITVNYREAFKLNVCCGILFNHESALRPPHFVIKKIINGARMVKEGFTQELVLGNLSISRDWGYAPYYVEAMWLMMQQERMDDYLICSGEAIHLRDFVDEVFSQFGLDSAKYVRSDPSLLRSLDLEVIYGDNTKAKTLLGWKYDLSSSALIKKLIDDEMDFVRWTASLPLSK